MAYRSIPLILAVLVVSAMADTADEKPPAAEAPLSAVQKSEAERIALEAILAARQAKEDKKLEDIDREEKATYKTVVISIVASLTTLVGTFLSLLFKFLTERENHRQVMTAIEGPKR